MSNYTTATFTDLKQKPIISGISIKHFTGSVYIPSTITFKVTVVLPKQSAQEYVSQLRQYRSGLLDTVSLLPAISTEPYPL